MIRSGILACIVSVLLALTGCGKETPVFKKADLINSVVVVSTFRDAKRTGHGSGVILERMGDRLIIVTAYHVIDTVLDKTDQKVMVSQNTNSEFRMQANILLADKDHDLAVIAIPDVFLEKQPIHSCKGSPEFGEKVVLVGAPLVLDIAYNEGIVANPRVISKELLGFDAIFIEVTSNFVPGESGGGIFRYQEGSYCLAGIVDQSMPAYSSLNFAIDIHNLRGY